MFALSWQQVDLNQCTLEIRGALVHDETGKLIRKQTNKNRSSRRMVPIMIPRLQELLASTRADHLPTDPVLTCHPNSAYKQINSVCEAANLPLIGVHGLRHSFASLAYSLGIPERECMALGGWQDPQTMRKIYTHLDTASKAKAAAQMSSFFAAAEQSYP